jgi:hypothetical protein
MLRAFCIALSRLFDPLCRGRRDARLDDEMAEHLDALRDDFAARGLSATDADAAARRAFGGVDQAKARYRDQRGWPALDALGATCCAIVPSPFRWCWSWRLASASATCSSR